MKKIWSLGWKTDCLNLSRLEFEILVKLQVELSKLVTSLEPPSTEPGREDTEHGSLDMCHCCGIYGNTWNCNQFNVNFTCQSQTPVYICTATFLVSTSFKFVCLVGWLV